MQLLRLREVVLRIYILLSIKTRIETQRTQMPMPADPLIYILLSIKTRIETSVSLMPRMSLRNLYPTIH